ncbi:MULTISPECIES: cytochrome c biogenesis CcdA family protein [unclassified Streptomyces]|uniref:cytochrome c biogenesis CcdA family protein n=1 Tax=unclassified Streptomyces TaxID=2593676 RepID=UPI0022B6A9D0|nr:MULTISPECIES: cytochrome c biogenesis CcdA family protein [unclassified Streptomyces]MCZ7417759.1 cytochrome c biogenesis CcdA family protein [Streptomyces sp. WMMC897]MCZ7432445.1 cytochrome c biogenesis CcdA family protein [Streptomyces sp. WMMC1477]
MSSVPYSLAVTAGMLAAVNPCGFALLPAYLGLFVGSGAGERGGRAAALRRAGVATAAMTGGFTLVFGAFGLVVSPLALSVERWLPWVTVFIGLVLLLTGGWLLGGRELRLPVPRLTPRGDGRPSDSARSMGLYGVSYAVASLSCTVGPFLALTSTAFRGGSVPGVIGVFLAYAAGMGVVVGVLTLAVALSRQALIARIRGALPYVTRASGILLILAGAYVAYYGWYELRVLSGEGADDPVVTTATEWQGEITRWLNDLGFWPVAGAAAVLLAVLAAVGSLRRRRTDRPTAPSGVRGRAGE